LRLLSREELEQTINLKLGATSFLVTYHPVTLSATSSHHSMNELLLALDHYQDASIIFTEPNSDTDGRIITQMIHDYAVRNSARVVVFTSMGQLNYLSALKHVDVVIGNSSSGITEAPVCRTPTVNVGNRQTGRLKATSVIDCDETEVAIVDAINRSLSSEFKNSLSSVVSLYGSGEAVSRIIQVLKEVPLEGILMKKFYDL
jgi:UDP-hydrolysing UDP-N-acetyl-D-glucosamine 2-epimerase